MTDSKKKTDVMGGIADEVMIVPAYPSDAEELAALIRLAFADVAKRLEIDEESAPTHPSNCAPDWIIDDMEAGVEYEWVLEGDVPVGCVAMSMEEGKICQLRRLCVLPDFRNDGIGSALIDRVAVWAIAQKARAISVGLIAEDEPLFHWYRARGFISGEINTFNHLPFAVRFMSCPIS